MTARYTLHGNVAVVTIDNPPVNGMGYETRRAMAEALERALEDPTVVAIVFRGAGKLFSGGADIREFGTPDMLREPNLHSLIRYFEESGKPIVAALHGTCMGGGLELALGAHYRVAAAGTQIALPEVKIGLLPGAGGTQRLPRAVGLQTALKMIVTGDAEDSAALAALPGQHLLNAIVGPDLLDDAVAFARERAATGGPHPLICDLPVNHPDADALLDAARRQAREKAPQYPAPLGCIDALAASVALPFEQGLQAERDGFLRLMTSPESRALRHAFFAERAAARIADVPANTPVRNINTVGVIGAGTMGTGIAMNFLNAGMPVTLLEMNADALERGLGTIRKTYASSVSKGKLTAEQAEQRLALIRPTLAYDDLRAADLVIEAVFEELPVKQNVFRQLDAVAKAGAILATNTSTLDVDAIAAVTHRPADVVGLHFFSPAHLMKLLEIVRAKHTALDVLATVMQVAKRIRKTAVVARVCDCFIGNRMIEQYVRQATFLLEEGALPKQIDDAVERFGFAMGPFRMSDLAGNDIGWAIRKRRRTEKPELSYSRIPDLLCERGRFGQKTGAGWYDYASGERAARPNSDVDRMIEHHSAQIGVARRAIADREIIERLMYSLVNEGAKILEEGIAASAGDIDVVYLTGYGFPLHRGGPMRYADEVGLYNVVRAMKRFARNDPTNRQADAWAPAPLLAKLAASGGTFTSG